MKISELPRDYKGDLLEIEIDVLPASPKLRDCTAEDLAKAATMLDPFAAGYLSMAVDLLRERARRTGAQGADARKKGQGKK
jgi:hypothetical protein